MPASTTAAGSPRPAGGFSLDKWYLDVIADDGRTFIGYVARIEMFGMTIPYAAWIKVDPEPSRFGGARVARGGGFRGGGAVRADDHGYSFTASGVEGRWRTAAPALGRDLLVRDDGIVRWDCVAPAAEATVATQDGWRCVGRGYMERLRLTIPPWRLPIRELRWGRIVTSHEAPLRSVIWIEWRGEHPLKLAVVDGVPTALGAVTETSIEAEGVHVRLEKVATIRDGELGQTVLARAGRLTGLTPARVLGIRESKWLARGHIQGEGTAGDTVGVGGWAIHEVVRW